MITDEFENGGKQQKKIATMEWIVAAIGALFVLALLAFLMYDMLSDNNQPPRFLTTIQHVEPLENQFLLEFEIANFGDRTAASVTIEASLVDGDQVVESHTTTIDYVPALSNRRGGVFFSRNPADFDVQIHAVGYQLP